MDKELTKVILQALKNVLQIDANNFENKSKDYRGFTNIFNAGAEVGVRTAIAKIDDLIRKIDALNSGDILSFDDLKSSISEDVLRKSKKKKEWGL